MDSEDVCDVTCDKNVEEERLGIAVIFRWKEINFNQASKRKKTEITDQETRMLR